MLDGLVAEELQTDLGSAGIGRGIIVLEQTASTNNAILQISNTNSKEGIGVNVNQSREDFPTVLQSRAISLAMALGKEVDRQKFASALLRNLDRTYRELFGKG